MNTYLDVYDKKARVKQIGQFCRYFRKNELNMLLGDFAEIIGVDPRSLSAFEHGNANSLNYLDYYYYLADEEQRKMFSTSLFKINEKGNDDE